LLSIGTLLAHRGEYTRALSHYQEALDIQAEIGHKWGRAFTMQQIGSLYQDLRYLDGARDLHEKSLSLMKELGLKAERPGVLANIGMDYHLSGDDGQAVRLLSQALVMTRQLGSREAEPSILEGLALVWLSVGNHLEARHYCDRLLAVARERGLKRHLAAARRINGEILMNAAVSSGPKGLGWQKAELELKEALRIARSIEALPILWRTHRSLWEFYGKRGDDKKALKQLAKAREAVERIVADIEDGKLLDSFLRSDEVRTILAGEQH
jgi:tetratricopeptide (TPR) repeat protein